MSEAKTYLSIRIEETAIEAMRRIADAKSIAVHGRAGEIEMAAIARQAIREFLDRNPV